MKEKNTSVVPVVCLPKGCFEGNCRDCIYRDWSKGVEDGYVYCDGGYGGWNRPENRNGCNYYKQDPTK